MTRSLWPLTCADVFAWWWLLGDVLRALVYPMCTAILERIGHETRVGAGQPADLPREPALSDARPVLVCVRR